MSINSIVCVSSLPSTHCFFFFPSLSHLATYSHTGFNALDVEYVQPALGEGKSSYKGLILAVHESFLPSTDDPTKKRFFDASIVANWLEDFWCTLAGGSPASPASSSPSSSPSQQLQGSAQDWARDPDYVQIQGKLARQRLICAL